MRPEVRILVGLAMIGAGAAGLLAMNLWTLPAMVDAAGAVAPPCPPPSAIPAVSGPRLQAPPDASPRLSASASDAPAVDGSAADAPAEDGSAAAASSSATVTSKASDGTAFPAIRFEERSRAPSRELMTAVEPMAAYLRGHFEMKVVLVGHGDAGMVPAEYVQTGRVRAGTILRMLVDYGVSVSRISVEEPKVEGGAVAAQGVPPGTVEATILPRFETQKGDADVR